MEKKPRLGRGLDALLGGGDAPSAATTSRGASSRSLTTATFEPTSIPAALRTSLVRPR